MKQFGCSSTTPSRRLRARATLLTLSLSAVLLGACGPGTEGEIVLPSLGEASQYTTLGSGVSMTGSGSTETTASNEEVIAGESGNVSDTGSGAPSSPNDGSVPIPEPEPGPEPDSTLEAGPQVEVSTTNREAVACNAPDDSLQARFLERVNAARAQARSCGSTAFDPAPPVAWNNRSTGPTFWRRRSSTRYRNSTELVPSVLLSGHRRSGMYGELPLARRAIHKGDDPTPRWT